MYDALYASGIPSGADIACWYPHDPRSDGPPKDARQVLTIDNTGSHLDCAVLDCEPGAAWPLSAAHGWVQACTAPFPTVYCALSNAPQLVTAMAGVTRSWYLWVASWTGQPHVPAVSGARVIGCQYQSTSGYDLSIVTDDNWYPLEEATVASVQIQNGWVVCNDCKTLVYAPDFPAHAKTFPGHVVSPTSASYALPFSAS
jgi:hypothetical protein